MLACRTDAPLGLRPTSTLKVLLRDDCRHKCVHYVIVSASTGHSDVFQGLSGAATGGTWKRLLFAAYYLADSAEGQQWQEAPNGLYDGRIGGSRLEFRRAIRDSAGTSKIGGIMVLLPITDENDLRDGRTYLCCRSSRHGNAIWETLEAQKHRLLNQGMKMSLTAFERIYQLPKRLADIDDLDRLS